MSDRYLSFANTSWGRRLIRSLGWPVPTPLERWSDLRIKPVDGALMIGGDGRWLPTVKTFASQLSDTCFSNSTDSSAWTTDQAPLKAVVFDASGLTCFEHLNALPQFFKPLMRHLDNCPKLVMLGQPPHTCSDITQASIQRALEGFIRSLGKEVGHGGNAQLLYVHDGAETQLEGALRFFLSPKCAYVSGQVIHLKPYDETVSDWSRPLANRHALVTGSARGIGAAIAETLARDGAHVILLDTPAMRETIEALATRLNGQAIALDITAENAPDQLRQALPDGIDILVHNAGITRDKTLAKMTDAMWNDVMDVNLKAPLRLTQTLLDSGTLRDQGRIVLLTSISGIAGNRGQTNYASSKAGLIGLAQAWAPELAHRGITINAVAPGFIETAMTAAMPLTLREAGRRMNSMVQGGLPQDVAETVAWLAQPSSGAVSGQVLRVCGQSLLGA